MPRVYVDGHFGSASEERTTCSGSMEFTPPPPPPSLSLLDLRYEKGPFQDQPTFSLPPDKFDLHLLVLSQIYLQCP